MNLAISGRLIWCSAKAVVLSYCHGQGRATFPASSRPVPSILPLLMCEVSREFHLRSTRHSDAIVDQNSSRRHSGIRA